MKQLLTLFIVFWVFNSNAQDYIPFPDSIATWNVANSQWDDFGENGNTIGFSYHLQGDTIVNDTAYSKLYIRQAWTREWGEPGWSIYENFDQTINPYILIGGIREDDDKKVWYKNFNFDEWWAPTWLFYFDAAILEDELKLYDFGMEIGDTLITYQTGIDEAQYNVLTDITIDLLGRRNFLFDDEFSCSDCYVWIEGVGNFDSGPFSIYQTVGESLAHSVHLKCYSENDEFLYPPYSSMYSNCEGNYDGPASLELPYTPFPDSTALWSVVNSDISETGDYGGLIGINYKLIGDTIIDEITYSKLYNRIAWGSEWNPDGQGYENLDSIDYPYELIGVIREDDDKKVCYKNIASDDWWTDMYGSYGLGYDLTLESTIFTDEILLYDFDLSVGDSIEIFNSELSLEYFILDDIYIGLADIRNFTFTSSDGLTEFVVAEGIGGFEHGLFSMYVDTTSENSILACFSVNGEQIYAQESETYADLGNCEGPGFNADVPVCVSTISGLVFYDMNSNGTQDTDEPTMSYPLINANEESYSVGDVDGRYIDCIDVGSAEITLNDVPPYYTLSPSNYNIVIEENEALEDLDFALIPISDIEDLSVDIFAPNPDRPGFYNSYYINYSNVGTECIDDVSIEFNTVTLVTITSVLGGESSDFTDQMATVSIGTLCPFESGTIHIIVHLSPDAQISDLLVSEVDILPTEGDENVSDNSDILESYVVGSYDPNDKMVDYVAIDSAFVYQQKKLTYLIRFQNTGNYYAENVVIKDFIEDDLIFGSYDPTT